MSEKTFNLSNECVEKIFNRFQASLDPSKSEDPIVVELIKPYGRLKVETLKTLLEEAFWASLTPEEGRYHEFRISLGPHNEASADYVFSTPKKKEYAASEISDLAAVLAKGYKSLGVWFSSNGNLEIWGIVEIPNWYIQVTANGPGQLLFSVTSRDGWDSFEVAITGSWWGFVDKSSVPISRAYFAGRHPGTILDLGLETVFKGFRRASAYESIAKMMLQHQHGGALIIVPEDLEHWRDSLEMRYAGNIFEEVRQSVDESNKQIQAKKDWGELFKNYSSILQFQEKSNRALEFVAQLTAVDGATVIGRDLAIYGFGAKLKPKDSKKPLRILLSKPFEDEDSVPINFSDWGVGTRHKSAAQFVFDHNDCVAVVCSQDGRLSALSWDVENDSVQVVTNLEYAL